MSEQLDIFNHRPAPRFDGPDLEPEDTRRLVGQLERVANLMSDGEWRTLRQIADHCECSEASASARLRDLRKKRCGSKSVERRRDNERRGLWWYRVVQ